MKLFRTALGIFVLFALALAVSPAHGAQQQFDNFVLVVDQSAEMNKTYHDKSKHLIARETAREFIKNVPTQVPIQGAIYMYGVMAAENENKIKRIYSMHPFNKSEFLKESKEMGIQTGPSSLSQALRAVRHDLNDVSGRTAIIIISGGNLSDVGEPGTETKKLKEKYGDNVCIFTILVGKIKKGGENLDDLVRKGKCGYAADAGSLDNAKKMERYAYSIFFGAGDDKDLDGVANKDDKCPDTPFGASVDYRGCWAIYDVQFDSGKADIKPEYNDLLDEIAAVMNVNPGIKIVIEGHTDSEGDDSSNMQLSQQRANAVMNYLVNAEVDAFRLRAIGKGESEPIGDNSTAEGKAQNRRIEFKVQR